MMEILGAVGKRRLYTHATSAGRVGDHAARVPRVVVTHAESHIRHIRGGEAPLEERIRARDLAGNHVGSGGDVHRGIAGE